MQSPRQSSDLPRGSQRTVAENVRVLVPVAFIQTAFYMSMNQLNWLPPRTLPLTAIDRAIPFLPWTVIPYFVLIFGGALPAFFVRRTDTLRRALWAYALCVLIAAPIFLFWPTHCPRPELSALGNQWDDWLYRQLAAIDTKACAFPSFHIILPTLCGWIAIYERQRFAIPFCLSVAFLSLTILTTKQHYFWDLLGGLGVAAAGIWLSRFLVPTDSQS